MTKTTGSLSVVALSSAGISFESNTKFVCQVKGTLLCIRYELLVDLKPDRNTQMRNSDPERKEERKKGRSRGWGQKYVEYLTRKSETI